MHYKNGRPAKLGDKILVKDSYSGDWIGTVVKQTSTSESCNLGVIPHPLEGARTVTAKDCLHTDDIGENMFPAEAEKQQEAPAEEAAK